MEKQKKTGHSITLGDLKRSLEQPPIDPLREECKKLENLGYCRVSDGTGTYFHKDNNAIALADVEDDLLYRMNEIAKSKGYFYHSGKGLAAVYTNAQGRLITLTELYEKYPPK